MDQIKTGQLIRQLRCEQGLTQKQLAERIHISDKTVSKWETGNGFPDVSLLNVLARVLGVRPEILLSGEKPEKERENGTMKKLKFYVCPDCGNVMTSISDAEISCCGKTLRSLEAHKAEEADFLNMEAADGEWYITSAHEMSKAHYIAFVAFLTDSTLVLSRQYPEWNLQVHMPCFSRGRLVWYCTRHGLMYRDIRIPRR